MRIEPERLAYWYLRLNGFLTIVNFLVHPETRRDRSTEVDVLGVRFPFRTENLTRPMEDDGFLTSSGDRIHLVIAEVKRNQCSLNGPWTDPKSRNMEKVIAAIGAFAKSRWRQVASSLYKNGFFEDDEHVLSLLCIGRHPNEELQGSFPRVPQVTFEHILRFVHGRFVSYLGVKAQHAQWDPDGKALWNASDSHRQVEDFLRAVSVEPGTNSVGA